MARLCDILRESFDTYHLLGVYHYWAVFDVVPLHSSIILLSFTGRTLSETEISV